MPGVKQQNGIFVEVRVPYALERDLEECSVGLGLCNTHLSLSHRTATCVPAICTAPLQGCAVRPKAMLPVLPMVNALSESPAAPAMIGAGSPTTLRA